MPVPMQEILFLVSIWFGFAMNFGAWCTCIVGIFRLGKQFSLPPPLPTMHKSTHI